MTKRKSDRRKIERRAGKRGVTVRIEDEHPDDTKRVRRGAFLAKKNLAAD